MLAVIMVLEVSRGVKNMFTPKKKGTRNAEQRAPAATMVSRRYDEDD